MKILIYNGKLIQENAIVDNGFLIIEDSVIADIGQKDFNKDELKGFDSVIDAKKSYISPGFIDVHVHGVGDCDPRKEGTKALANAVVASGVTSFLPTIITSPEDVTLDAVKNLASYIEKNNDSGAEVLGINLEGPYLNPEKCGAHQKDFIRKPNEKEIEDILKAAKGNIKIMTLAPECEGALDIVEKLKKEGIIPAIGHTMADYKEAQKAICCGMKYITHIFNAMGSLHHREPGVVAAGLLNDEVTTEIIVDGIHVHPSVIKLLCRLKRKDKIILISDSLVGIEKCLSFEGKKIQKCNCAIRSHEGLLMGSVLGLNKAIENITKFTDLGLTDAVKLATINPAKILGVDKRKGSLDSGKDADIVIFDDKFDVKTTIVRGKIVVDNNC